MGDGPLTSPRLEGRYLIISPVRPALQTDRLQNQTPKTSVFSTSNALV